MSEIRHGFIEAVLTDTATLISHAHDNPLVNFEIQRRLADVPGNLMDLFYMRRNDMQIRNWHTLSPWERFGWVGTLMRRRVPGVSLSVDRKNRLVIHLPEKITLTIDKCMPVNFKNSKNFWKGMDDFCLLIGVCFYIAVMNQGGTAIIHDSEFINDRINSDY